MLSTRRPNLLEIDLVKNYNRKGMITFLGLKKKRKIEKKVSVVRKFRKKKKKFGKVYLGQ
jgi:hypothetical protein